MFREARDGGQDAVLKSLSDDLIHPKPAITVQCKFTSNANRHLRASDIENELVKIRTLLAETEAQHYLLMTNMSVDGRTAVEIKKKLRATGVIKAHVFGREFLTLAVKTSARLRALVPRIYGLGDLSVILDERAANQTRALLGHMIESLKVYVPTEAHRAAVRTLAKHKILLLIGDPGTGKSTIGSILATTASEDANHTIYKADGPDELIVHWNPDEAGGFYWIDDAFGANQLRDDFVDRWIQIMDKVQAATEGGNRFVLTSRRHIYEAAKRRLGTRNHPLFRSGDAVVDVGSLSAAEREQILYNHVKLGRQSKGWKSTVKPYLTACANQIGFVPEIARRLGDPTFTGNLALSQQALLAFFREPREHLIQTINELAPVHLAALTLVFLHRGRMPSGDIDERLKALIGSYFNTDPMSLGRALAELKDSFLIEIEESGVMLWTFKHPTISDALAVILASTEGTTELFLTGSKIEAVIGSVVSPDMERVRDAVVLSPNLEQIVVERLPEISDEPSQNRKLFFFLADRASDTLLVSISRRKPDIFQRVTTLSWRLSDDPKIKLYARLHQLHVLPPELRMKAEIIMDNAIDDDLDVSFIEDGASTLELYRPASLLRLYLHLRKVLSNIPDKAREIAQNPDLDMEPEENFTDQYSTLQTLKEVLEGDEIAERLWTEAEAALSDLEGEIAEQKEKSEEEPDYDDHWQWQMPGRIGRDQTVLMSGLIDRLPGRPLSPFSDVDE